MPTFLKKVAKTKASSNQTYRLEPKPHMWFCGENILWEHRHLTQGVDFV